MSKATKQTTKEQDIKKQSVMFEVDNQGYLSVDLTQNDKLKGVKVKFERIEGRTKRLVGLIIGLILGAIGGFYFGVFLGAGVPG